MQFNTTKFSKAVLSKRKKDGLSKNALSILIGIDRSNILRYEAGKEPSLINFARLCEWMGVKMETFFK